jgi:hypothetical protein
MNDRFENGSPKVAPPHANSGLNQNRRTVTKYVYLMRVPSGLSTRSSSSSPVVLKVRLRVVHR